jgi:hypothetical protein
MPVIESSKSVSYFRFIVVSIPSLTVYEFTFQLRTRPEAVSASRWRHGPNLTPSVGSQLSIAYWCSTDVYDPTLSLYALFYPLNRLKVVLTTRLCHRPNTTLPIDRLTDVIACFLAFSNRSQVNMFFLPCLYWRTLHFDSYMECYI